MLIGPAKSGKTTCAATISEYFPEKVPAAKKTYLKDMVWCQFDTNGVETLRQLGTIPYIYDFSSEINYGKLKLGIKTMCEDLKKAVAEGVKYLVIDTITALDAVLLNHMRIQYPDPKFTGVLYNQLLGTHMDFALQLKQLPLTIIVIAHTKVNGMGSMSDDKELNMRKRASGLPGQSDIVAEISGKAANFYKGSSDLICPVLQIQDKYWLLPYGGYGFEGGGRFPPNVLEEKEPANLRKLLDKISYKEAV